MSWSRQRARYESIRGRRPAERNRGARADVDCSSPGKAHGLDLAGLGSGIRQLTNLPGKLFRGERLLQELAPFFQEAAPHHVNAGITRDEKDRDLGPALSDTRGQLATTHFRHHQIHHEEADLSSL